MKCAKDVSIRYQGKPSMGTSIRSCTPFGEKTAFGYMFFDKGFLVKCHEAMSERKLSDCRK